MNIWQRLLYVTVLLWSLTAAARAADPAQVGQWEGPFSWPIVPVHLSVLPSGQVLAWSRGGPELTYTFDPNTGQFQQLSAIMDLFCSGHAFLPDGQLLVTGG